MADFLNFLNTVHCDRLLFISFMMKRIESKDLSVVDDLLIQLFVQCMYGTKV